MPKFTGLLSLCLVITTLLFEVVHGADEKTTIGNNTIERTVQLRTHSVYAPYIDQDLQNRWWDFGGDAYINTNKHIRLTQNKPSQMGWLWSRLALTATNYVIETEFRVSGDSSHLYGDGMAMWLTTERAQPGPVFGSKDYATGLGIFLDTYANERHTYAFPRIVGILFDGRTKYDHNTDGDSQAIGACSANFRRTNVATKLKVTYVKAGGLLDVKIQYRAWDEWTPCFSLKNITLPTTPFIGYSALTGDVSDAHEIISVTTYSAILSAPDAPLNSIKKNKIWNPSFERSGSGGWLNFFFKLFVFAAVCAGGWYGYREYQRRKRYGDMSFSSLRSSSSYPPSAGYAPSSAGYAPSSAGYAPSTPGYAPPLSAGFGPSTSGYGPPSATFGPPSAGLAPRSAGLASSSAGFGAPSPGFGPPASAGYASPGFIHEKKF